MGKIGGKMSLIYHQENRAMSNELTFNGPAEFYMEVFVTNDETGQQGRVTIGLGTFGYPTKERVAARIEKFKDTELVDALDGFRLMTKPEAWEVVMFEKTGTTFAMAGTEEWDLL